MNEYLILDVTEDSDRHVICQAATRGGAMEMLKEVAVVGMVYHEAKLLGLPIEPKERTAVTLGRVAPAADEVPEKQEEQQEEEVPAPKGGGRRGKKTD